MAYKNLYELYCTRLQQNVTLPANALPNKQNEQNATKFWPKCNSHNTFNYVTLKQQKQNSQFTHLKVHRTFNCHSKNHNAIIIKKQYYKKWQNHTICTNCN